jgi:ATP-binding cassette, subfamily B, bacterial
MSEQKIPNELFKFICFFLKPYKYLAITFILISLTSGLWGPFNSIIMKKIVNAFAYAQDNDINQVINAIILLVVNYLVFDNVMWRSISIIRHYTVPYMTNNIIKQLTARCLEYSSKYFHDNLSGQISKQIITLAEGYEKIVSLISVNFFRAISIVISSLIITYFINAIFCIIFFIWLLLFFILSLYMSRKLIIVSEKQAIIESKINGELVDLISNQYIIKLFSKEKYEINRLNNFLHHNIKAYQKVSLYSIIMHIIQGILIALMISFSSYYLLHLYQEKLVSIGDFILILGLAIEIGHMMWYTMYEVDEFNKIVGKCRDSLHKILGEQNIVTCNEHKNINIITSNIIKFDKVSFNYNGRKNLFDNINIHIKSGEKVGLVGYSGSGKTSFVNLILRMQEINSGNIYIGNSNIKDYPISVLRNNIIMVPQEPCLFNRSIMENIRYGEINATDEEVIEAAKLAFAHDFISALPHGYDSSIGERGISISGGERQRIAIARAILKNCPITIMDEPTSQLDSLTENLIQSSISNMITSKKNNNTVIIIAHRLSTLLKMDRILVFDQGKIIEDGTHQELLAKNQLYKRLWDSQIGGFII